jgi:hypothetical protein
MGVYDVAANQVLAQPVSAFYQGRAIRSGLKTDELQQERLQQDIDLAPTAMAIEAQKAGNASTKNMIDMAKLQMEVGKRGVEALTDAYASGLAAFDETGDPAQAYEVAANKLAQIDPSIEPEEARAKLDEATGGVFDPKAVKSFLMTAEKHLEIQAANEKLTTDEKLIENLDVDPELKKQLLLDIAKKKGAIVGRTPEDVAIFGGSGDKVTDRNTAEIVVSAENMISSVQRIGEQIEKMPQASMGLPGTAARLIDNTANAVMGFGELFGGTAMIGDQEVSDSLLLDAKLYQDMFQGPAAQSAALQANEIGLAYALARSANPDGRISDADVRAQLGRVKLGGSSKTQIQAAMREVEREVMVNTANYMRIHKYSQDPEGKVYYDSLMEKIEKIDATKTDSGGAISTVTSKEDYNNIKSGDLYYVEGEDKPRRKQ